jgi:F-type H+-transporting ATPase subunit alpha
MTVSLWVGTTGRLDKIPATDVLKFEQEFLDYLRTSQAGLLATIRETLKFEDDTEKQLAAAYDAFLPQFETSDGHTVAVGSAKADALGAEDIEQEQIVKQKRG